MTIVLRVNKLVSSAFQRAVIHNSRDASSKDSPSLTNRSDPEKLHMNQKIVYPEYAHITTSEELWKLIRENFDQAKKDGRITRKKFIPRTANRRGRQPVETSIAREIILQISSPEDGSAAPVKVFNEFIFWLNKYFPGDIIRVDMHNDETCRHIHILVTTWSLEHSQNYTKNNLIDQFKIFQRKAYLALKEITKKYGIDLLPPIPKIESGLDHLPPSIYDRYGLEIESCKKYLDELHWEVSQKQKQNEELDNQRYDLWFDIAEFQKESREWEEEVIGYRYELDTTIDYYHDAFLKVLRSIAKQYLLDKLAELDLKNSNKVLSIVRDILQDETEDEDEDEDEKENVSSTIIKR